MLGGQPADDLAGGGVQRGEQVDGAVPGVVVAAPLGHSGDYRQHRGGPLQRLDLRFFVHGEDCRVRRRGQVQVHDARILPVSSGSGEILKSSVRHGWRPKDRQMRCTLVAEIPTCQASSRFDQCMAPSGVSSKGTHHHFLDLGVGDGARHSRLELVGEPVQSAGPEPGPPLGHGQPADAQPRSASPWAVFRRLAQFSSIRRSASDSTSVE